MVVVVVDGLLVKVVARVVVVVGRAVVVVARAVVAGVRAAVTVGRGRGRLVVDEAPPKRPRGRRVVDGATGCVGARALAVPSARSGAVRRPRRLPPPAPSSTATRQGRPPSINAEPQPDPVHASGLMTSESGGCADL